MRQRRKQGLSCNLSHSPDFVKVALIVFLAILAVITVARFIVGVKLTALGLWRRGRKLSVPRRSFVRDCLPITSSQWSVRRGLMSGWRLVMSSVGL